MKITNCIYVSDLTQIWLTKIVSDLTQIWLIKILTFFFPIVILCLCVGLKLGKESLHLMMVTGKQFLCIFPLTKIVWIVKYWEDLKQNINAISGTKPRYWRLTSRNERHYYIILVSTKDSMKMFILKTLKNCNFAW